MIHLGSHFYRTRHRTSRNASPQSVSRREILKFGGAGLLSLNFARLLAASDAAGSNRKHSVILVHLDGGAPQMDTIDPKPLGPSEVRGEFAAISTAIPGVQFTELVPGLAANAKRFAFIRSLVGSVGRHDAFQCQSGFSKNDLSGFGGRPAFGSVINKLNGKPTDPSPLFVDMMQGRPLARNSARPGFLGPGFQPFRPDISQLFQRELEAGMKSELARLGENHATSLELNKQISVGRLDDRLALLKGIDRIRRDLDANGMMGAMDQFSEQAVNVLTSGALAKALDLSLEDPRIVDAYRMDEPTSGMQFRTSESTESTKKFLLARRLIQAGARVVSMSISDFDTHSSNFPRMRHLMPIVDHGLVTLVDDLASHGMLDDVTILAWGEFGRTPTINSKGGRDHWPKVGPAILAGGGMKTGQIIGATDRNAAEPTERPVTYKDVFATLYYQLGIDPHGVTITDPTGRPQYLLDEGQVIRELV